MKFTDRQKENSATQNTSFNNINNNEIVQKCQEMEQVSECFSLEESKKDSIHAAYIDNLIKFQGTDIIIANTSLEKQSVLIENQVKNATEISIKNNDYKISHGSNRSDGNFLQTNALYMSPPKFNFDLLNPKLEPFHTGCDNNQEKKSCLDHQYVESLPFDLSEEIKANSEISQNQPFENDQNYSSIINIGSQITPGKLENKRNSSKYFANKFPIWHQERNPFSSKIPQSPEVNNEDSKMQAFVTPPRVESQKYRKALLDQNMRHVKAKCAINLISCRREPQNRRLYNQIIVQQALCDISISFENKKKH